MLDLKRGFNDREYVPARTLLFYIADLGAVGFIAALIVTLSGVALEVIRPGLMFNHVSPQRLVLAMVFFGGLALLIPKRRSSTWRRVVFSLLSLVVIVFVVVLARRYFIALESRTVLTIATTTAASIVCLGANRLVKK
ncbi:hypothetical protein KKF05_01650 [Patescibacteria group bacterium]|nr:hypothetical protein [Patescibacteria group bacterium]MBU1029553.1 hypothetical protein [Patescibacteria group bacterium]MBU1915551.1 hypothetical protein [Patescibacteria group bacterium]